LNNEKEQKYQKFNLNFGLQKKIYKINNQTNVSTNQVIKLIVQSEIGQNSA